MRFVEGIAPRDEVLVAVAQHQVGEALPAGATDSQPESWWLDERENLGHRTHIISELRAENAP